MLQNFIIYGNYQDCPIYMEQITENNTYNGDVLIYFLFLIVSYSLCKLSFANSKSKFRVFWGTPLLIFLPASCFSALLSVQMRSAQSTAQSQPDFTVPVMTLDPVVLPCGQCQYLIWHSVSFSGMGWLLTHRVMTKHERDYSHSAVQILTFPIECSHTHTHNYVWVNTHACTQTGSSGL